MAYIRPLANGNFPADVRMKGIIKNKTFPSQKLAQTWADNTERSIKAISTMDQAQLLALSDEQIENMGGEDLFKQLGIDLFSVRHAVKLEAINALSKKELLQLTPQEIERMVGAELFIQAGKRIQYKTFREVCNEYLSRWNKKDFEGQTHRVDYWCRIFGDQFRKHQPSNAKHSRRAMHTGHWRRLLFKNALYQQEPLSNLVFMS